MQKGDLAVRSAAAVCCMGLCRSLKGREYLRGFVQARKDEFFFQIGLSHPKLQQPSMCATVQVFRSWKEEESDATVKDQLLSKQVCDFS